MERRLAQPHLEEVGPGVHAWIQPEGEWGESNAGLVVGEGEALLVDTLWDQTLTRRMLSEMAPARGAAAIRTVVNTHSDGDHWWGNATVPDDAEIITSEVSAQIMATADPQELVRFRGLANALGRLPGRAGAFGRYTREMLRPFRFEEVTLRPATRTFAGEETLTIGGREVRLIQVGPAHTPGDLIVFVPDARVVFAADVLFVGTTPVMWAGPVAGWLAALDTLLGLEADVYVPGHGPVCGREEIVAVGDHWRWLEPEVARHHTAGRSPWQAAQEIARSPEFAAQPFRRWRNPERLVINATTIMRNLDGAPAQTSPLATIRLFARVAALSRVLG
jgi:glyoxylase-like metal-dependent hydrolase (beta-lactamase superfamily II)